MFILASAFVTRSGIYAPLIGTGATIMAMGSRLLHALDPDSRAVHRVGYEVFTGWVLEWDSRSHTRLSKSYSARATCRLIMRLWSSSKP